MIDLGDAGDVSKLAALDPLPGLDAPARQECISDGHPDKRAPDPDATELLTQLLQDDPRQLKLDGICDTAADPKRSRRDLQHRDEARQYGGASSLMAMPRAEQLIRSMKLKLQPRQRLRRHYLLASRHRLLELHERSDLVREALAETIPQYTKSRIAAAWSCLRLGLVDQNHCWRRLAAAIPGTTAMDLPTRP